MNRMKMLLLPLLILPSVAAAVSVQKVNPSPTFGSTGFAQYRDDGAFVCFQDGNNFDRFAYCPRANASSVPPPITPQADAVGEFNFDGDYVYLLMAAGGTSSVLRKNLTTGGPAQPLHSFPTSTNIDVYSLLPSVNQIAYAASEFTNGKLFVGALDTPGPATELAGQLSLGSDGRLFPVLARERIVYRGTQTLVSAPLGGAPATSLTIPGGTVESVGVFAEEDFVLWIGDIGNGRSVLKNVHEGGFPETLNLTSNPEDTGSLELTADRRYACFREKRACSGAFFVTIWNLVGPRSTSAC